MDKESVQIQEGTQEETVQQETEETRTVSLGKPYVFEGKEYESLDLSGLDKLTVQDAIDAQRRLFDEREMATALMCETTTAFARALAAKATGLPIEFFKLLPRGASRRVMAAVRAHLNVDNTVENHVMTLAKPYQFKGKTYTSVDLNGIADLNSMNESEAENRLARSGIMITDTSVNYLYPCVLASMATGLEEEFFTGLPLCETLKLKNAVNDAGFFE